MNAPDELFRAKLQRIEATHRFQRARTALVVVDMQRGFLEPGASLEVPAGRAILPNLKRLVDACRALKVPVIFTQFVYHPAVPCLRGEPFGIEHLPPAAAGPIGFGQPSGNCLIGPSASTGRESAEIVPPLAPREDELVVAGYTYDKFYGTPLDLALRSRDIRYLILTGVVTDICVNATLISASTREYRVTAVTDGVATLSEERQRVCLAVWENKYARLKSTAAVVEELASA